jgi:hypothetical protein
MTPKDIELTVPSRPLVVVPSPPVRSQTTAAATAPKKTRWMVHIRQLQK